MAKPLADKIPIAGREYGRFTARPITGSFGAAIANVQIAHALGDDGLFGDLHDAWVPA